MSYGEKVPDYRQSWGAKYERGCTHFKALERRWDTYTKQLLTPGRVLGPGVMPSGTRIWQEGDRVHCELGKVGDPPGSDWSLVIGDCIQNFRSGLDHIIWELSSDDARQKYRTQTQFPIITEQRDWPSKGLGAIRGVISVASRVVESFQPYQSSAADPSVHPLTLLQALSNVDKHQRIHVAQPTVEAAHLNVGSQRVRALFRVPQGTRVTSGLRLVTAAVSDIDALGPSEENRLGPELWTTITFEDSGRASGEGVMGTLRRIKDTTGQILDELQGFVRVS